MQQNLLYFLSVVVGAILSYLINQLPNIPDNLKSWTWIPVIGLTLLSAWLVIRQNGGRVGTSVRGNKIKGNKNKLLGKTGASVDRNEVEGDGNEIGIDDGSGRNP